MDFSPEKLRAHFADLTKRRDVIDAKLDPLREELDQIVAGKVDLTLAKAQKREAVIREKIKGLQAERYPVEMERAAVARALGGKTGE